MQDSHAAAAHHPAFQHHFETMEQQREASTLGMWLFLITEILFFGGMFTVYLVYRNWYFASFAAGSLTLDLTLGAFNTVVLIGSSLTMALAVHSAETGQRNLLVAFLLLTILLGATFLGVKAVEYSHKFEEHHVPGPSFRFGSEELRHFHEEATALRSTQIHGVELGEVQLFFSLYFAMTGMHALHMVIGIGVLSVLAWKSRRGVYSPEYFAPVEYAGLYWHFVDIVWIFLFPLLYLITRHVGVHP